MSRYFARAVICVAALGAVLPAVGHAQKVQTLLKTESGCSVFVDAKNVRTVYGDLRSVATWKGDCLNGLAQGEGVLRITVSSSRSSESAGVISTVTTTMKTHRGRQFGFSREDTSLIFPSISVGDVVRPSTDTRITKWRFNWEDWGISFWGLGLEGDDTLLNHAADAMPRRSVGLRANTGVGDDDGSVDLLETSCLLYPARFPDCGFGESKPIYNVYVLRKVSSKPEGRTDMSCPQPKELASCADLAAGMQTSYVVAAEVFIRESMPKVREMELAMQNALLLAAREKERAAKAQADAAVRAAREQAQANATFDGQLATASVGELFAMADEFKSKGDLDRARKALRQLMGRFPDHKLAGTAAGILTEMQGK